ncbi:ion channel POLLUX-like 2 [Pyrus ussuriensis x Pyrus communis]|uniref:Ion channel POLLUX-like 2 n=1 Tax=Pyrus ussuriensis x Pyrus communis TaxID=2448454 RepID=A0A5N5HGW3_9ROSA|nr:ion channel POLLUX-like 2 [Pyrus ussuriensis x Pyrus communis]
MSKLRHETEGFNIKFVQRGTSSLSRSPKANPTSSFSSVDSEMPQKNIDQWKHKLMKAEKELVDLNSKANEALYRASKQKTKATTFGERIPFLNFQLSQKRHNYIECYKHSGEGNAKMKEERNKGFEDFRQVVKEKEPNEPQWDSITV